MMTDEEKKQRERREYQKKWRDKNKEILSAVQRRWREENPEKYEAQRKRAIRKLSDKRKAERTSPGNGSAVQSKWYYSDSRFSISRSKVGFYRLTRLKDGKKFYVVRDRNSVFKIWHARLVDDAGVVGKVILSRTSLAAVKDALSPEEENRIGIEKSPKKAYRRRYEPGQEPWVHLGLSKAAYRSLSEEKLAQRRLDRTAAKKLGDTMTRVECLKAISFGHSSSELLASMDGDIEAEFKIIDSDLAALLVRVARKFPDAGYSVMSGRLRLVLGKRIGSFSAVSDREQKSLVAASGETAIGDDDS